MIKQNMTVVELAEALDFAEFHEYNEITLYYGEDEMGDKTVGMSKPNDDQRIINITDLEYRL